MPIYEILGEINQQNLSGQIRDHEAWLRDPKKGKRLDLAFLDIGGLRLEGDLSKALFYKCKLDNSLIYKCQLESTKISECVMHGVHFEDCSSSGGLEFKDCLLIHALFDRGLYVNSVLLDCRFDSSSFQTVSIKESEINNTNFVDSSWTNGTFYKTEFRECNLKSNRFSDFYLNETKFKQCKMVGINLLGIKEYAGISITESDLEGSVIENFDFRPLSRTNPSLRIRISENNFTNAKLNNTNFNSQQLYNSIFDGAEINKASFSLCGLNRSSFIGAKGSEVSFGSAKLYNSDFTDASLPLSFWEGALASRSTLLRTNLEGASLKMSDFSNCSMQNANIKSVSFGGCNLSGVAWPAGGICEPGSIGQCNLKPHP